MADNTGVAALGTKIEIGDGNSPEAFHDINNVHDIDGPEITQEFVDFTHQQTTGGFREEKPSFKSGGTVTFACDVDENDTNGQGALITAATAVPATKKSFKITYPDNTYVTFAGYPSIRFSAPLNGAFQANVTIRLSGNMMVKLGGDS